MGRVLQTVLDLSAMMLARPAGLVPAGSGGERLVLRSAWETLQAAALLVKHEEQVLTEHLAQTQAREAQLAQTRRTLAAQAGAAAAQRQQEKQRLMEELQRAGAAQKQTDQALAALQASVHELTATAGACSAEALLWKTRARSASRAARRLIVEVPLSRLGRRERAALLGELETDDGLRALVQRTLEALPERYARSLVLRFGLDGQAPRTDEEIAAELETTKAAVEAMQRRALNILRHPATRRRLRDYWCN